MRGGGARCGRATHKKGGNLNQRAGEKTRTAGKKTLKGLGLKEDKGCRQTASHSRRQLVLSQGGRGEELEIGLKRMRSIKGAESLVAWR